MKLCQGSRRDGKQCQNEVFAEDLVFCEYHHKLSLKYGDERIRGGQYPRHKGRRDFSQQVLTDAQKRRKASREQRQTEYEVADKVPEVPVDVPVLSSVPEKVSPEDVRPRLAEAAADALDEIQRSLLEAAVGSTREHWVTVTCPDCLMTSRHVVNLPDVRSRVSAIELLLREGLGRPAQSDQQAAPTLPDDPVKIRRMGWEEMEQVAASLQLETLHSALEEGAETTLRQGVNALSREQRALLAKVLTGSE